MQEAEAFHLEQVQVDSTGEAYRIRAARSRLVPAWAHRVWAEVVLAVEAWVGEVADLAEAALVVVVVVVVEWGAVALVAAAEVVAANVNFHALAMSENSFIQVNSL